MNTENLKTARKKSGKTQKEIADSLGVGQSTYKNYECGLREPNGDMIVALANLFDVTTDYLLGRPDAKPLEDLKEGGAVHWYETLKSLREKFGESMSKTAEFLGIPKGTYASYEYGKREPNIEMITKIAKHYKVTTDYLLGRPDAKQPDDPVELLAAQYKLGTTEHAIIASYLALPQEDRTKLVDIVEQIAKKAEEKKPEITVEKTQYKQVSSSEGDKIFPTTEKPPGIEEQLLKTQPTDEDL